MSTGPRSQFTIAAVAFTRRGWAFLGTGMLAVIVAYASGRPLLLYVGILLLVLPALALLVVRARRPRLEVTRHFWPDLVAVGHPTEARITLTNLALSRSVRGVWWEQFPWGDDLPERDLPRLLPRRSWRLEYSLRPPKRGVYEVGPLGVEYGDGFGLTTSTLSFGSTRQLIVTPEVVQLGEAGLAVSAGTGEARMVQRRATGDEDDAMTREYRSGDAMRRVHWRATARHDELMVRQEGQRSLPRARILIDTMESGYADDGDAFEWVVRMLASVAVHLRRAGFQVAIEESGEPQLNQLARRRTWGDEELLAALASVELTRARQHARPAGPSDGPVIAIVGGPDPATLAWISHQRRSASLAITFMVRNASALEVLDSSFGRHAEMSRAGEQLLDEGWVVVPVRADDDHAAAWEAVAAETGRARERA